MEHNIIKMDHQFLFLDGSSTRDEDLTATMNPIDTLGMGSIEWSNSSETAAEAEASLDTANCITFDSENDTTSVHSPSDMDFSEMRSREGRALFSPTPAPAPRVVISRVTARISTEELECLQRSTGNGLLDTSGPSLLPREGWVPMTERAETTSQNPQNCLARLGHVQSRTLEISASPTAIQATPMSTITTPVLSNVGSVTSSGVHWPELHRVDANAPPPTPKPSFLHRCKLELKNGFSRVRYAFPGYFTTVRELWEGRRKIPVVRVINEEERVTMPTDTYDGFEGGRRRRLEERDVTEEREMEEMEGKERKRMDALLADPETPPLQSYKVPNEFGDIVSRVYPLPGPVVSCPLYEVGQPVQEVPKETMSMPQVFQIPPIALSDISDESYQRDIATLTPEQRRNKFARWPRSRWPSNYDLRSQNWDRDNQWADVGWRQQAMDGL